MIRARLSLILFDFIQCSRGHGMFDPRMGPCPVCKTPVYVPRA
ncbi:hypothetical protein [Nocardiopsis sp. NRRL B-16309]|nr:hypothetical protein [Nocardiopsis sp. NRRL B-16309]